MKIDHPNIETFGTTFDSILEECFGVRPPISQVSRDEIESLMKSEDPEEIKERMNRLGHSVEKGHKGCIDVAELSPSIDRRANRTMPFRLNCRTVDQDQASFG